MKETREDMLNRIETGIRGALAYELRFSKKNGFKKGQYWLHRKVDQLLDEMRDHYELGAWSPHFTNDIDYTRGMLQAYKHVLEICPGLGQVITEEVRQEQGPQFVKLLQRKLKD